MLWLVLIGTVFLLWLWSKRSKNEKEPPLCSGSKIFIGHALKFAGDSGHLWDSIKFFSEETLERGGVLKTTVGPRVLYILTDPEDFLTVLNACVEKDAIYNFAKSWLGDGLVTSSPFQWKIHRKLLNPAFNQNVLDGFIDVFNQQSRVLVDNMKVEVGKGPFDHWSYIKQNTLETIVYTALGVDFKEKTETNIEFCRALQRVLNILITRFQRFWLHNNFVYNLTSMKKEQDECIKILHNTSNEILKQSREHFRNSVSDIKNEDEPIKGHRFKSFMDLILELSVETNIFTDRAIREHVDTIIVAGHDSNASVLMFCSVLVGSYPRVQKKIHEELNNVFGDDNRDVTKQDLAQLVYLEAVIKESMRLFPPAPIVGRHLDKDIKLRNCTLSKGNSIFLSIYGLYRHSIWGPDVEEFRPERWLDSCGVPSNPYLLAAFGAGRRNCIGKSYAMMSIKITLAHIYRNYLIHGDHTKLKLKLDVMLKPVSGFHITIEKRK